MSDDPRLKEFLQTLQVTGRHGVLLGRPAWSLQDFVDSVSAALPGRRLLAWNSASAETLEALLTSSFWPGCSACLQLDESCGFEVFRLLEELLSEGQFASNPLSRPPEGWHMIIHAKPGGMPFLELIPYKLRLD